MDLAHGFLAQQMTEHDQRTAELVAERRSVAAERRALARSERVAAPRRGTPGAGLLARLQFGRARSAH
ncbi:hypothetical protein [Agromyces kandeliae]|uniref:Uncharacterized protein n=1 Tax=Agromyces kandeliae TaxID=2666141 RepID=A0A6L5R3A5_9MICO|nr:hypothetical protein [Agromyces kandeliae]MRX44470.1 hypothetical protein [Agromyces kandeliae]